MPAKMLSGTEAFKLQCCLRASGVWILLPPEAGETFRDPSIAEGHSASSSSSSFVTVELNSVTGVWDATYSAWHAVQRTPVSKISQV